MIGAGITGLSAAWELVRQGERQVTVLEATERVGGKLRTGQVAGAELDLGAESILARRPEGVELLGELGLEPQAPADLPAGIWSRGQLHPMPRGTLLGVPGDPRQLGGVLTEREIARAEQERPVRVNRDLSVAELVSAAVGESVVDRLVEPLLGGVYAGDPHYLSAQVCLPALFEAARDGSRLTAAVRAAHTAAKDPAPVFAGLRGGIGTLPATLGKALQDSGVDIRTGSTVTGLTHDDDEWQLQLADGSVVVAQSVIMAIPAPPAARLIRSVCPAAAASLSGIDYASVALASFAFAAEDLADLPRSTGFLVPAADQRRIKAATFASRKWPWLAQAYPDLVFIRASMGRAGAARSLQVPDDVLLAQALADLRAALGHLPDPVDHHLQRWGGALPQYAVGHRDLVAGVRHALRAVPTLELAGAAYDGVGIPACIGSGRRAARAVRNHLNEPIKEGIHD